MELMAAESEVAIKLTEMSDFFSLKLKIEGGESEIVLNDLKLGVPISELEDVIRFDTEEIQSHY